MARIYATSADYQQYTGQTPPSDIEAVLGRASRFLDSVAFRLCWYEVDEDGYPANAVVRDAFTAAVCAQAQWWDETGDEHGIAGRYSSVSLGSLSLSRGGGPSGGGRLGAREVAAAALEALQSSDLTPDVFQFGAVSS